MNRLTSTTLRRRLTETYVGAQATGQSLMRPNHLVQIGDVLWPKQMVARDAVRRTVAQDAPVQAQKKQQRRRDDLLLQTCLSSHPTPS
jgi:hypothetical protein